MGSAKGVGGVGNAQPVAAGGKVGGHGAVLAVMGSEFQGQGSLLAAVMPQ